MTSAQHRADTDFDLSMAPEENPSSSPTLADAIFVINLDQRPERLERFEQLAKSHPVFANWRRIPAIAGKNLESFGTRPWFRGRDRDLAWAGRAGCVLSHRKAIETALESGFRQVCILEDDADFPASSAVDLAGTLNWLSLHQDQWQIAYLGFTEPASPSLEVADLSQTRKIFQIAGCATTHAYILQREAMEWILANLPTEKDIWPWIARHRAIDRWYSRHLASRFPVVAVSPSLIGQYSDFSDIGRRDADQERNSEFYTPIPISHICRSHGAFAIRFLMRQAHIRLMSLYDCIRASRKHRKGF